MGSREFIEAVLWHLDADVSGRIEENEQLTAARSYGVVDGCAFCVWSLPARSAWCVWRDGEPVDVDTVRYCNIANPEDVANGIRAWAMRLNHDLAEAFGGAA